MNRVAVVKSLAIAAINGGITLAILLIAPLGLASVITNTLMVMLASFLSAIWIDQVEAYLRGAQSTELPGRPRSFLPIDRQRQSDHDRR